MEKEKIHELNNDELLEAEAKVSQTLKKINADYKNTKEKGGQ